MAAKWVATTIMMGGYILFILFIPGMAHFVAVPANRAVDWHFGQLLAYRLLAFLPNVRQPMLDAEARRRDEMPESAALVPVRR